MMKRFDWWFGIIVLAAAILLHAAVPRYQLFLPIPGTTGLIRFDRWTGIVEMADPLLAKWVRTPADDK